MPWAASKLQGPVTLCSEGQNSATLPGKELRKSWKVGWARSFLAACHSEPESYLMELGACFVLGQLSSCDEQVQAGARVAPHWCNSE